MKKVDHDSRRLEVAAAAAKLIAEKGMEGLTTRALATAMGCSIGVLSHYFSSKDDIVLAAFRWADTRIDGRMQEVLVKNPTLDGFIPLIRAGLPLDEESDMEWRVRFNLYAHNLVSSSSLSEQVEKLSGFRRLMNELIATCQDNGVIRKDIASEQITNVAFDLVIGAAQNLLMTPMEEREAYVKPILALVNTLRPDHERGAA